MRSSSWTTASKRGRGGRRRPAVRALHQPSAGPRGRRRGAGRQRLSRHPGRVSAGAGAGARRGAWPWLPRAVKQWGGAGAACRVVYMLASLVAALVSAFCYGVAAVMHAMAIRSASRRPARIRDGSPAAGRVDPGLLVRLLRQWRFLASLAIDIIGFLAQLVALRRLPLFAVQAVIASNLAVTALFAAWLMPGRLRLRECLAVTGGVVGVGLLGTSAGAEGAADVDPPFQIALMVTVAVVAVAGTAAAKLPNPARPPG